MRNVLGSVVALVGAAAAMISPFANWHGGQSGLDLHLARLFTSAGPPGPGLPGLLVNFMLPMLVAAVLVALGVLFRSRLPVALGGLLALALAVLWTFRMYGDVGELRFGAGGVGAGEIIALAAGIMMLLGAMVMAGRREVPPPAAEGPAEVGSAERAEGAQGRSRAG